MHEEWCSSHEHSSPVFSLDFDADQDLAELGWSLVLDLDCDVVLGTAGQSISS